MPETADDPAGAEELARRLAAVIAPMRGASRLAVHQFLDGVEAEAGGSLLILGPLAGPRREVPEALYAVGAPRQVQVHTPRRRVDTGLHR